MPRWVLHHADLHDTFSGQTAVAIWRNLKLSSICNVLVIYTYAVSFTTDVLCQLLFERWKSVLVLLAESIFLYFTEQKDNDNILQQSWSRRKNQFSLQWGFSQYALVYWILLRTGLRAGWEACGFWVVCTYQAIWVHFPCQSSTVIVLPWEDQVRSRVGNVSPGGCWIEITPNPVHIIS